MNKEHILKQNNDFQRIISTSRPYKYKEYVVYVEKNNDNNYYFGFSVGKKVGNAVIRNKYKRRIKNIIDNTPISFNGYDVVIISRPKLKFSEYSDIENNIIKLMNEMVK